MSYKHMFFRIVVLATICSGLLPFAVAQKPLKRFTQLPGKKTGIRFKNVLKDLPAHNILVYSNYYGGAGVGVGDFNKDGLPDLFFAGNLVADQLYLNRGHFQFDNATVKAGITDNGGWSSGVVVADVNQDGWDDIYVCRELYDGQPELRRNKLYINNKVGGFDEMSAQYKVDDPGRSRHACFFDYDHDGDLDLLVLNQPPNPGNFSEYRNADLMQPEYSLRLYRNDGSSFKEATKDAGILKTGYPNSVAAGDFDQDGFTDLYIANDYEAPDFFYHNNGDGTFTDIMPQAMRHTSFYSMGVDAADINNDGLTDLMVLDMVAEDNYRLKANMSGMDPKAFWKVYHSGGYFQYMFNNLHLNRGNNTYSDIAQLAGVASSDWSWSNLIADFDNDGLKDIHVTNGLMRDIRNTDAQKQFANFVKSKIREYRAANPQKSNTPILQMFDLEEALALIPSEKLSNYLFKNQDGTTFNNVAKNWGLAQKAFSHGSAYADLDNDGDLDLIINNVNDEAFIYRNNSESFANSNYLQIAVKDPEKSTTHGTRLTVWYAGRQQHIELAYTRGMYSTSTPLAHFGLGTAQNVDSIEVVWPDGLRQKLLETKANQRIIITKNTQEPDTLRIRPNKTEMVQFKPLSKDVLDFKHLENSFDDFAHQVLLPHQLSRLGPALATGDVNGDGLDDLYFGGAAGVSGKLYLQSTSGKFVATPKGPWQAHQGQEDVDAVFVDFDQDGDLDLIVGSGGNEFPKGHQKYLDRAYRNRGNGQFVDAPEVLPAAHISSGKVAPCDFDGDGWVDLFIGGRLVPHDYPTPCPSLLLRNVNGQYVDVTKEWAPMLQPLGLVTDAVWFDANQDQLPDLAITGEWMPVTILINNGKGFTKMPSPELGQHVGWWYAINKADIDGDGDDDLIAGNLGLNYKYKASPTAPFEVFYDDYDEDGKHDIILSYYNFGKRYPLRGRSCSAEQVPALKSKFPSYQLFAGAGLKEVYGSQFLKKALNYQAHYFASAYLENKNNGQFSIQALPVDAQLSSINAIIPEDFNQDGHLDLLVAGNMYAAEVETTRNDAGIGLLLLGDGSGGLEAVPAHETNLYLPFDTKKAAIIRYNGKKALVVANNNDDAKLIVWEY